jgi:hypothetical protein
MGKVSGLLFSRILAVVSKYRARIPGLLFGPDLKPLSMYSSRGLRHSRKIFESLTYSKKYISRLLKNQIKNAAFFSGLHLKTAAFLPLPGHRQRGEFLFIFIYLLL